MEDNSKYMEYHVLHIKLKIQLFHTLFDNLIPY